MTVIFPPYVLKRMTERGIGVEEVEYALEFGEMIEFYDDRVPPRRLMLGWVNNRPIHVVGEDDPTAKETIAVTAYEPTIESWTDGFTKRK
ncbi:MAG: DUF4258 domain-containing protein [Pyrinomonadaceae bacterium MAG19_C2-C3]|nr:DUF4258 domain-containing protein [Pyrinomonadaceae bacterium MAG19_C2-C3]